MSDKLKEKVDKVKKVFETTELNSSFADCGCDDYCECFIFEKLFRDDDIQELSHSIDDLVKFVAENFGVNDNEAS